MAIAYCIVAMYMEILVLITLGYIYQIRKKTGFKIQKDQNSHQSGSVFSNMVGFSTTVTRENLV